MPHITLKAIANNAEIDVMWERFQEKLEPLRKQVNKALGTAWEEWEIPRQADDTWSEEARSLHADWWEQRIARQKEIDASIAAQADYEYLYHKPYEDSRKIRVAGPFTVDSLSPHRVLSVNEDDELIDHIAEAKLGFGEKQDFAGMILEHLKHPAFSRDTERTESRFPRSYHGRGTSSALKEPTSRAMRFRRREARCHLHRTRIRHRIAPRSRASHPRGRGRRLRCPDRLRLQLRSAHSTEFEPLGRIPVLKARMNADLHMADDLKNTGKGNLFVIFGEPDIDILDAAGDDAEPGQVKVRVNGVDVFHPNTGEIRSDSADGIACWFVDTDYNEESFFVRQAYFLGANDPYKALKTTLKAEINLEAWETLHSDTSRPFDKPTSGRIAVKVINHLGDEVMKVFRV